MKVAVLTALTGDRHPEGLQNFVVPKSYDGVDFIAFVDRQYDCQSWNQVSLLNFCKIDDKYKGRREAKLPKVLGSLLVPGYDFYIWHDPYLELMVHPQVIVDNYLKDNDFALFRHPQRKCAYEEIEVLKVSGGVRGYDHKENLFGVQNFLLEKGYPKDNGLFELPAFMYRNSFKVCSSMLSWWEMICKYSSRDQVSFPYIVQTNNLSYGIIPGTPRSHEGGNNIFPQVRPFD